MNELVEHEKTPADLARALKTKSSTVSNWTRPVDPGKPNPFYARAIAKFLGLPPAEVLERAGHVVDSPTSERPRINPYVPEGGKIDADLLPEILDFAIKKQAERDARRRKEAEEGKGNG